MDYLAIGNSLSTPSQVGIKVCVLKQSLTPVKKEKETKPAQPPRTMTCSYYINLLKDKNFFKTE